MADQDVEQVDTGIEATDITTTFAPKLRESVGSVIVDGEALLLEAETGVSHLLNQTGSIVLQCFDGVSTIDEIAVDVADAFGADRETVTSDLLDLAKSLGALGLLAGVRRYVPPPREEDTGLPVGTALDPFVATDADGAEILDTAALTNDRTVLVNWGSGCGFCTRIATTLAESQTMLAANDVRLVLVTTSPADAIHTQLEGQSATKLTVGYVAEAPSFFQGKGTPVAYVLDRDGTVAAPLAIGALAVPELVEQLVTGDAAASAQQ